MSNQVKVFAARFCLVIALAAFGGGCGISPRKPAEISYFLMQPEFAPREIMSANRPCVTIRPVSAQALYRDPQMVYRVSDVEFETDYYNRFMAGPPQQFTGAIRRWADALNWPLCPEEITGNATEHYILRPVIEALYGDFRDKTNPAAVVEMQFTLTHVDPSCQCSRVLLSEFYAERVRLETSSPAALVRAQQQAVESILRRLASDLAEAVTE